MRSPSPQAPQGWYTDPGNPEQFRFWDGTQWSGHTAPVGSSPPVAAVGARPERSGASVAGRFALALAAVALALVIGILLMAKAVWDTEASKGRQRTSSPMPNVTRGTFDNPAAFYDPCGEHGVIPAAVDEATGFSTTGPYPDPQGCFFTSEDPAFGVFLVSVSGLSQSGLDSLGYFEYAKNQCGGEVADRSRPTIPAYLCIEEKSSGMFVTGPDVVNVIWSSGGLPMEQTSSGVDVIMEKLMSDFEAIQAAP